MSEQSGWYIFSVSRREFPPTDFYGMYELIDLARAVLLAADNIRKRMRDSTIDRRF
ncbi:MAG TPA: hypothetical protein VI260_04335 [Blastocatellia bacterium]